jgi:Cyclic nucleotide-binding domain
MSFAELSGYLAAGLVFFTFYMKTMIPLRVTGLCANVAFITYGALNGLYPVLILHVILLPLNGLRLMQMMTLTRQVREAAQGDLNMDWIKPFTTARHATAGEVVFRKGDEAPNLFVIVSGRYRLAESGIALSPPQVVGEFALLAPERKRTQTLECVEEGTLLQLGYSQVEQLFFQNPKFGFYFLKLITARLFANIERLESENAALRAAQPA